MGSGLLLLGCSSTTKGPPVDDGNGGAGGSGGAPAAELCGTDDACCGCTEIRCLDEAEACAGNTTCSAVVGCLEGCSEDLCRAQCLLTGLGDPGGLTVVDALRECAEVSCEPCSGYFATP